MFNLNHFPQWHLAKSNLKNLCYLIYNYMLKEQQEGHCALMYKPTKKPVNERLLSIYHMLTDHLCISLLHSDP